MKLRYLTAGESHGKSLVGIIEGLPSNLSVNFEMLKRELFRRRQGFGRSERQKTETDEFEILAGIRFGKTLGSPIAIVIPNKDWENWQAVMSVTAYPGDQIAESKRVDVPRPGHADFVGGLKYEHADMRNVLERASARETAMRVALATFAKMFLAELDIQIASRVTQIGEIKDNTLVNFNNQGDMERVENSPLRMFDSRTEALAMKQVELCASEGDTLGGIFEVCAENLPLGLGSYSQWDQRLEGKLAQQFMSLNAIKSFEVGNGAELAGRRGSQAHDEMIPGAGAPQYLSNRAGGITGGMSTGEPLIVRVGMKPLATLRKPLQSVSVSTGKSAAAHFERSDVCAVPSASIIGEGLMALALAEGVLEKFGGDSLNEIKERVAAWRAKTEGRQL